MGIFNLTFIADEQTTRHSLKIKKRASSPSILFIHGKDWRHGHTKKPKNQHKLL